VRRHRRKRIIVYSILIPVTVLLVLPILLIVVLSFRPDDLIQKGVESVTSPVFVLDNYRQLFTNTNLLRYFLNSTIVSVVPAVLSVLIAILAGYSLVRFRFAGSSFFYPLPLFAQTVPIIQLLVPFYVFMLALGLLNTYMAVILVHMSLVLPICVWMMVGYLRAVPWEIEEAAMVDGCSRLGAVFRVVLPIAVPGITATAVVAFLETWGEFLPGFVLNSTDDMRLLVVAVFTFVPGQQTLTLWGMLFAAAVVFMIPSVVLFLFLQRSFRAGLSLGSGR
jgi:ABC-type glycerol-3-phosphate transport system permease component